MGAQLLLPTGWQKQLLHAGDFWGAKQEDGGGSRYLGAGASEGPPRAQGLGNLLEATGPGGPEEAFSGPGVLWERCTEPQLFLGGR